MSSAAWAPITQPLTQQPIPISLGLVPITQPLTQPPIPRSTACLCHMSIHYIHIYIRIWTRVLHTCVYTHPYTSLCTCLYTCLYTRSLRIKEAVLGADHPDLVSTISNIAVLHRQQSRFDEAHPRTHVCTHAPTHVRQGLELLKRGLRIQIGSLGRAHPSIASTYGHVCRHACRRVRDSMHWHVCRHLCRCMCRPVAAKHNAETCEPRM